MNNPSRKEVRRQRRWQVLNLDVRAPDMGRREAFEQVLAEAAYRWVFLLSLSLDANLRIELYGEPARAYLVQKRPHLVERWALGTGQLGGIRDREHHLDATVQRRDETPPSRRIALSQFLDGEVVEEHREAAHRRAHAEQVGRVWRHGYHAYGLLWDAIRFHFIVDEQEFSGCAAGYTSQLLKSGVYTQNPRQGSKSFGPSEGLWVLLRCNAN
jgi:hypothetical protein